MNIVNRFFKKYLSFLFIIATLLSVAHHHDDLQQHPECKICVVHSHLSHADTPQTPHYIKELSLPNKTIEYTRNNFYTFVTPTPYNPRAPPYFFI